MTAIKSNKTALQMKKKNTFLAPLLYTQKQQMCL